MASQKTLKDRLKGLGINMTEAREKCVAAHIYTSRCWERLLHTEMTCFYKTLEPPRRLRVHPRLLTFLAIHVIIRVMLQRYNYSEI